MERYLDPTNDVGFKKVFSDPIRMIDFLNSILRLPIGKRIQKIEFVPTEQIPDLGQGKRSLFDLKCQDESGTYFLIEMQCRRSPIFLKRMQYYGAHASSHPPLLKDPCVNQAFETMERANWTPEEYDAYVRARLLLETEELTAKEQFDLGILEGEARGEAIGLEKGETIGIEKTAYKLLSLGLDKALIMTATGLSSEIIEQLKKRT